MQNIITRTELSKRLNLSLPTIWRMTRDGQLPKPLKISARRVGWIEADIEAWLATKRQGA